MFFTKNFLRTCNFKRFHLITGVQPAIRGLKNKKKWSVTYLTKYFGFAKERRKNYVENCKNNWKSIMLI